MSKTLVIILSFLSLNYLANAVNWQGNWAFNCDFRGGDLKNERTSGAECGPKCANTPGCTHFSWTKYNGGTCWMKTGSVTKANAIDSGVPSIVCGIIAERSQGDSNSNQPNKPNPPNSDPPSQPAPSGSTVTFNLINNCPYTIWPGMDGLSKATPGWKLPFNGGWQQNPGETKVITVPKDFEAGRFWARTGCKNVNGRFQCETGDCGPWVQCAWDGNRRGGAPPATLAEFTLNANNQDYFDVSNVDGFNIPVSIEVLNPDQQVSGNPKYWCTNPVCKTNINLNCPSELQKRNAQNQVVGCFSACSKFNNDFYCCAGAYNLPSTCKSSNWKVDYPKFFKDACPDAYSYAYDDERSTFFCRNTNYNVRFC